MIKVKFVLVLLLLVLESCSCKPKEKLTPCEKLLEERKDIQLREFGDQKSLIESNERLLKECHCLH